MPTHPIGTQEEWAAAREDLRKREQELGELDEDLARQRQTLPWVPVEEEYVFDTEEEMRTLPELFEERRQLLIYHLMFGPSYEAACPGCTGLADHFDPMLPHLNNRDLTLIAISRAPIEKLRAYKKRMEWRFPYVSSFGNSFNLDFGFQARPEDLESGELAETIANPPQWLVDWAESIGTDLASGMTEGPGWNVFVQEEGTVYHSYSRTAPDRFLLEPFYAQLLDQVPDGRMREFPLRRHDEY
jgi:predicted dithiol-disulfide oxidoreductase (DUF899 family)